MTALLRAEDLTIGYHAPRRSTRVVASQLSVNLESGQMICLLGPNGAGKSTLLRTLIGAQKPLAGDVWLSGKRLDTLPIREIAKRVSIVLTDRIDVGLLSVYELVALGRFPHTGFTGRLTAADHATIKEAITLTHSEDLINRPVSELSDGERQRVMVARALAQETMIMVLDEPTAFLDLPRRVALLGLLRNLAHETGRGVIVATHELDIALGVADQIGLINSQGQLQVGLPEELVLNGSLESAFQGTGLDFDITKGTFTLRKQLTHPVGLTGDGHCLHWTAHALERSGYEVASYSSELPLNIQVHQQGIKVQWQLNINGIQSEVDMLGTLLGIINRYFAGTDSQ